MHNEVTRKIKTNIVGICLIVLIPKLCLGESLYIDVSATTWLTESLIGLNPRNAGSTFIDADDYRDIIITFNDRNAAAFSGIFTVAGNPAFEEDELSAWNTTSPDIGACGVLFADYNNDGHLDFYAPNPTGNQLFQFDSSLGAFGKYVETTSDLGDYSNSNTMNGAWGDYDGDSYVDLIIMLSGTDGPGPHGSTSQAILRNQAGDNFVNSNYPSGIGFVPSDRIISAQWVDFDLDNDLDLILIQGSYNNGTNTSKFFENNGEGPGFLTFDEDMMDPCEVRFNNETNLTAVSDFDNDGYLDILYSNKLYYGTFRFNPEDETFESLWGSSRSQTNQPVVWDLAAFDADLDGNCDQLPARAGLAGGTQHPRLLFTCWDNEMPKFFDWFPCNSCSCTYQSFPSGTRGMCVADFTQDGQKEIFFTDPIVDELDNNFFYDIYGSSDNNWVGFQLQAPNGICNQAALGTTVILTAGSHVQAQQVDGGSGRASQNDLGLSYGLGSYAGTVDVRAVLPNKGVVSGGSSIFLNQVPIGQYWTFDLDGLDDESPTVQFIHNALTGNLIMEVTWLTHFDTDSALDQITFYDDEEDAMVPSQLIHTGGYPIVPEEDNFRHKISVHGLLCNTDLKFYFSLQSVEGERMCGSSIHSQGPNKCLVTDPLPIPEMK